MIFGFTIILIVLIICIFGVIDNYMEKAFKSEWNNTLIENHEERIRKLEKILEMEEEKK